MSESVRSSSSEHKMLLQNISKQLKEVLETLNQMGFCAKFNSKDRYSIVVQGKNMRNGEARKALHLLMRKLGFMSVTDNIRVPACMRYADGSLSNQVKCKNCSFFRSVKYNENGDECVPHDHILSPSSFEGEPDWCEWDVHFDKHQYPYKSVLGRVIIFHPDYQPRLSKQARQRLARHNKH